MSNLPSSILPSFFLSSLLVAVTATGAAAQTAPSDTPAATAPIATTADGAPITHAWSDVSHINGQLVKVGESNDYLKTFRKTVIASNPVGWIAGFYGLSVSHAVSNHVAVRGDVNYINPVADEHTELWEAGVGVPLYLKRTYQGPFLEPGLIVRASSKQAYSDAYGNSSPGQETEVTGGPQMLFGWQMTWDSGFSVAAAAGIGRNLAHDDDEYDYDDDEVFFNGYFRVGYAF